MQGGYRGVGVGEGRVVRGRVGRQRGKRGVREGQRGRGKEG